MAALLKFNGGFILTLVAALAMGTGMFSTVPGQTPEILEVDKIWGWQR